ncbi:hypothetical protein CDAR_561121 [Caerostris darwini]|uniref:Uncharacterized protein n=1 Tax=Caerostris darwini TaxID=1538125 RepID=A0AAV4TF14_9ARAC|nr:hypothetical protein CDAR_561121 [Caerostris darwini]
MKEISPKKQKRLQAFLSRIEFYGFLIPAYHLFCVRVARALSGVLTSIKRNDGEEKRASTSLIQKREGLKSPKPTAGSIAVYEVARATEVVDNSDSLHGIPVACDEDILFLFRFPSPLCSAVSAPPRACVQQCHCDANGARGSIILDENVWRALIPDESVWGALILNENVWRALIPDESVWRALIPDESVWRALILDENVCEEL